MTDSNNNTARENNNKNASGILTQRIIVIGASAGGLKALKTIIKGLPPDFNASIFIVWHMAPDIRGILPQVFNSLNSIVAAHAYDGERILPNRIYIAPPDHHLVLEEGKILVTHGPKENRFRPAVDPLFRSAAYTYGNRVIGIILSGALDDGTAGLWSVKHFGGIAIVQDPLDAEIPSMPKNALRMVAADHCVGAAEMAALLVKLIKQPVDPNFTIVKDEQTKKEIDIAAEENPLAAGILSLGQLSPFTCPECHGVLSKMQQGDINRFRCHTGHAYTVDTLMAAVSEKIEDSLYSAIRGMDESILLLNHFGDHYAEANQPVMAAHYFKKAAVVMERSEPVRRATQTHEQLNTDMLLAEVENEGKKIPE